MKTTVKARLLSAAFLLLISTWAFVATSSVAWSQSRISSTLDGRTITVVGGSSVSSNFAGSRGEVSVNGFDITIEGNSLVHDDLTLDIGDTGEVELVTDGDAIVVIVAGNEIGRLERSLADVVADLRRRADGGDAIAQNQLGVRYARGDGVERSLEQAAHYYRLAAEQGDVFAMTNLGNLLVNNDEFETDYAEGLRWFEAAVEQGDDVGRIELGLMYERGLGVEVDYVKAYTLWREAAEMGNAIAQFNTAFCYRTGQGVEQDEEKGLYWLALSADQDYEPAQELLERLTTQVGNASETDTVLVADTQFPPTLPPASEGPGGPPPLPGGQSAPPPLPEPSQPSLPPYYAGINGVSVGPLDEAELRDRIGAGDISQTTLVWTDGMANWMPAGDVAELTPLFSSVADAPVADAPVAQEPQGFDGSEFLLGSWSGSGETMVEDVGVMPYTAQMVYGADGTYTLSGTLDVQIPQLPAGQTVAFNIEGSGTWTVQSATESRVVVRRVGSVIMSAPDLGIREEDQEDTLDFLQVVDEDTHRDSEGLLWTRQAGGS